MSIAKNYLNESELKKLNNLTNLFLDYAEDMAEEEKVMTMQPILIQGLANYSWYQYNSCGMCMHFENTIIIY